MSFDHPRRRFIGRIGQLFTAIAASKWAPQIALAQSQQDTMFAYVGSFTSEDRGAQGNGINVYRIDPGSGDWEHIQNVSDLVNPSFLARDQSGRFLYSAHADMDYATAFAIEPTSGHLTLLNRQNTGGTNGVHLAVDQSNSFLVVSNYASGSMAVLPLNEDGSLAPLSDLVTLSGSPGPHPTEQQSSHPHHNPFDPQGGFFIVPDKGLDAVFVFRLDAENGTLIPADVPSVATQAGAGPRHADFHPTLPHAYVINELDSTMAVYEYDTTTGALEQIQLLSTLPDGFTGRNTTAEVWVHPSGRFLYGSNRGHSSIVGYAIDQSSGLLSPIGWTPTGGQTPRYFGLDPSGSRLYACNQNDHNIVAFMVDQATGTLTPTGQSIETGSPVTIVFS